MANKQYFTLLFHSRFDVCERLASRPLRSFSIFEIDFLTQITYTHFIAQSSSTAYHKSREDALTWSFDSLLNPFLLLYMQYVSIFLVVISACILTINDLEFLFYSVNSLSFITWLFDLLLLQYYIVHKDTFVWWALF